jgi:hypothetical protein
LHTREGEVLGYASWVHLRKVLSTQPSEATLFFTITSNRQSKNPDAPLTSHSSSLRKEHLCATRAMLNDATVGHHRQTAANIVVKTRIVFYYSD